MKRSFFGGRLTWYFSPNGAHFRLPGWLYTRHTGPRGFSTGRTWRLLGLICLRHNDSKGGTLKHRQKAGWSLTVAAVRPTLNFRKADNYVRSEANAPSTPPVKTGEG